MTISNVSHNQSATINKRDNGNNYTGRAKMRDVDRERTKMMDFPFKLKRQTFLSAVNNIHSAGQKAGTW
jgi:hypothetical protein